MPSPLSEEPLEHRESGRRTSVSQPGARGRIVFAGAVHEARPVLDALLHAADADVVGVVTTTEPGSASLSGAVDIAAQAEQAGVPVVRADDINDPQSVARISAFEPDLLVVAGWTRLLRAPVLAVPRWGCVGFHASLLPLHRGRAPVNWSILLGEKATGNTMMLLDRGTDTGHIVDQEQVEIGPNDTCSTVYDKVALVGAKMLIRHLPGLLSGTAPKTPQDPTAGDVMPKRTPAMGVLDWDRSAQEVHDWVRALTAPYPGAFTSAAGQRMWVWATDDPRDESVTEAPGTILSISEEGVHVSTRGGTVLATHVSGENELPQASATWCRDHGFCEGTRFDAVPSAVSAWARGLGPKPEATAVPGKAGQS